MLEVEGDKDMVGRHVQAALAVAQGWGVGGQGCAARGHGYGPCVVCHVRHVVPSWVVPEGVGEWLGGVRLGPRGGRSGWGRGPRSGGSG